MRQVQNLDHWTRQLAFVQTVNVTTSEITKRKRHVWGSKALKRLCYYISLVLLNQTHLLTFSSFRWWWHCLVCRGQVSCLAQWSTLHNCLTISSRWNSGWPSCQEHCIVNAVCFLVQPTWRPRKFIHRYPCHTSIGHFVAEGPARSLHCEDTFFSFYNQQVIWREVLWECMNILFSNNLSLKILPSLNDPWCGSMIIFIFVHWKFSHSFIPLYFICWHCAVKKNIPSPFIPLKFLFWLSLWTCQFFKFSVINHYHRDWLGGSK